MGNNEQMPFNQEIEIWEPHQPLDNLLGRGGGTKYPRKFYPPLKVVGIMLQLIIVTPVSPGTDYGGFSMSLTITPTTTRIPIGVEIIDDSVCEEKESFSLLKTLLSSSDAPISIVNDLWITITDDDCCTLSISCYLY